MIKLAKHNLKCHQLGITQHPRNTGLMQGEKEKPKMWEEYTA